MIHATNSVPHARDPPQMVSVMEINVTQKQNSNKSFLKKAGKHGTINDMNGVRWMLCEHEVCLELVDRNAGLEYCNLQPESLQLVLV